METTRQETYRKFLKKQGFPQTNIDDEGDVIFMAEGRLYYIRTNADYLERFALVLPNFWEIEDEAEAYRVLTVCNEVHLRVHGVTLFCVQNNVTAAVELFLAEPVKDIKKIFLPSLKALQRAVYWFVTLMYKAEPPDDPPSGGRGAVPAHTSNGVENTGLYL
jgi:hypothetical protein